MFLLWLRWPASRILSAQFFAAPSLARNDLPTRRLTASSTATPLIEETCIPTFIPASSALDLGLTSVMIALPFIHSAQMSVPEGMRGGESAVFVFRCV